MQTIYYPEWLSIDYYENTIKYNPNVTLDGFCIGPQDEIYKNCREELRNNYQHTYMCDYWLDGYCWNDYNSTYHVPDTGILRQIEKKYDTRIPLGCLIIAVKHRDEEHIMSPDNTGFDLIVNKNAYLNYLKLNK